MKKTKHQEEYLQKLHEQQLEKVNRIMQKNLHKEQIKKMMDEKEREEERMIQVKLKTLDKEFTQRLKRKKQSLSQMANKNSSHLDEVKERVKQVQKNKDREEIMKIQKIWEEQKKREEILKDLSYRKQYRSVSASRNNREIQPPQAKTYSLKEYQRRMREAEKRRKLKEQERQREIKLRHEKNRLREENQRKMTERYKKLEQIKKDEIIEKELKKQQQVVAQKIGKIYSLIVIVENNIKQKREKLKQNLEKEKKKLKKEFKIAKSLEKKKQKGELEEEQV